MNAPDQTPQDDAQRFASSDDSAGGSVRTSTSASVSSDPPPALMQGRVMVTAEAASSIALRHALTAAAGLAHDDRTSPVYKVCDSSVSRAHRYGDSASTGVWHVFLPWFDGQDGSMLRSSRVIAVSQQDGRVLYDGSAHDEG